MNFVNMSTDKEQKKLERLLKLKSDSELAIFDEVQEIKDEIEELRSEIPNLDAVLKAVKGQQGEQGIQGEKGEQGEKGDRGEQGIQGPKGERGPQGPKGDRGEQGNPGKDGLDGIDGENGKDGSPDKPEEIVKKLQTIKSPWLDAKSIKNLPQPVVNNYQSFIGRGGGTSVGLETIKSSGTIVKQGASTLEFDSTFSVTPTVNGAIISAIGDGTGDVHGPASSTDNAIARFDGVTGKIIQDYTSGAPTISDTGAVTIPLTTGNSLVVDTDTFVVDATNNRVGLLTTAPTHTLTLGSTSTGIALWNTADQVTNTERLLLSWSSNVARLSFRPSGSGSNRELRLSAFTSGGTEAYISVNRGTAPFITLEHSSSSSASNLINITGTSSASGAGYSTLAITPTIAQSGTAGYTALLINPTESSTGSGVKRLISAQVGSVDKFVVDNAGNTTVVGNIIATKQIYYAAEIDNGNSGASDTIDWTLGNIQKTTMTADCTYTFTAPTGPGHYTLRIIQDGTGNWTATLPTGKWTSGIVPLIKDTASKWSILSIYYDGSAYSYSLNANLS